MVSPVASDVSIQCALTALGRILTKNRRFVSFDRVEPLRSASMGSAPRKRAEGLHSVVTANSAR